MGILKSSSAARTHEFFTWFGEKLTVAYTHYKFYLLIFLRQGLSSLDRPLTCCAAQAGLELLLFLPPPLSFGMISTRGLIWLTCPPFPLETVR